MFLYFENAVQNITGFLPKVHQGGLELYLLPYTAGGSRGSYPPHKFQSKDISVVEHISYSNYVSGKANHL